jgi:LysR family transcriptional activator of nhaA
VQWLNYHHLLYFWVVAREGSIARACEKLHLAQPTISAQLSRLERSLGEKLFRREGRNLVLTDAGQLVYSYAEEIFALGQELTGSLKGMARNRPLPFHVGVAEVLPKLIAYRLLQAALRIPQRVHMVCREERPEQLLGDLAVHRLDVVLSDAPANPSSHVRVFNHLLGQCGVTFFAAPTLAQERKKGFPNSLDGAPFLMPTAHAALRRNLELWFESKEIQPVICAEFEDSALLKIFGKAGEGIFAAPSVVAAEIEQQYGVEALGSSEELIERFYAISVDRKLRHPAVIAISEAARHSIFA